MTVHKAKRRQTRLTREEWLSRAFELLAREGPSKLHVETLVKRLGVTRGSFYWHFDSRRLFIRALVDYWARFSTQRS